MKSAMKKTAVILMSLLILALCGCKTAKESPTMEIFTDEGKKTVPLVTLVTDVTWDSTNLSSMVRSIPGNGQDFQITLETVPRTEPDRSNYLNHMRTELLAGKGPDLFIVNLERSALDISDSGDLLDPLFPFPEKSMKNRLFLPLDDYMENAETDFSKFLPTLMDACRNDEGQQLIPLTYNFDCGVFKGGASDIPHVGSREDMLDSGSPALEFYAGTMGGVLPLDYFGIPADYDAETLSFTEEELFGQAMLWNEHFRKFRAGEYDNVLEIYSIRTGAFIRGMGDNAIDSADAFVPARNRDGGVTANIGTAAAINRNSSYPELAFAIIDRVASESSMCEQFLYGYGGGIPANTELGGPDKPFQWLPMTQESYDIYRETIGQVTVIKIPTKLEQAVYENVYLPCVRQEIGDEDDIRAAVHKAYTTMQMMLAES